MPRGPRGEKRPADVIGNAVKVMRIATGEETDDTPDSGKAYSSSLGGLKGGKVRAQRLSPDRRQEIAKQAAEKRWRGRRPSD